ncbi:serine/threonine protein phosphatase [Halogeometricum borinquense]|uniref:Serine/threonine protein phosphatase n=1 Tax=Halogeometricum borinquense TaxID=60847 RepID=A0A6C0UHW7_9EURY|nr:metallophosphoesterase family protein [Halogeometricum borinquense]QIB75106.1 serine/threonine protein phosphatase [Halogeometricum borinquense]QIQ75912.1 serine/threonine protein phosphatase [Halogeometricum borinquense]
MSQPRFDADVPHRRIDVDDWDGVYVVGDVHGCRAELEQLLDELGVTEDDLVVFVGDLVRKGPDSAGVVSLVRNADNMFTVRGNNEEKLIRGTKELDALSGEQLAWIRNLPVAISWEDTLVVHGGVDPRKPLADHTIDELENVRSLSDADGEPYWWEVYQGPSRVFFGHTPLSAPVARRHAVGLDTGCVYGNELTAYDWREDEFVTVDTDKTVQERAESKWVKPAVVPMQ